MYILGTKEIFSFFLNLWKIHLLAFSTGKNFILFFVQPGIYFQLRDKADSFPKCL